MRLKSKPTKKELTNKIYSEKATIEKEFNTKYVTLKSDYKNSIAAVQSQLAHQIQQNKKQLQDLYNKYNQVKVSKWPAGSYCILQNGSCPPGFKSIQGWLRAINQFAANGNYVKTAYFGSSNIKCHGSCGQYGNWIGELTLSTCCK